MSKDLKSMALLEEISRLHGEKADLRVELHNQTLRVQELEQRVLELEENVRSHEADSEDEDDPDFDPNWDDGQN